MSLARPVRARLEAIHAQALAAVEPGRCLRRALRRGPRGLEIDGRPLPGAARLHLLAVGKAGAVLAAAAEDVLGADLASGFVLVPDGGERPLARCRLRCASHPLPDARGERATRELLAWLATLGADDLLLVLLSGGASSLLCAPADGLALADLARASAVLLGAGAPIDELNAVRKHASAAVGGRLARATGAGRIEVLVLSDVVGDRFDVIGSGPCAPDPSTFADALEVLRRRDPDGRAPAPLRVHLEAGARGERDETPKPDDPAFARVRQRILAGNRQAVAAACAAARAAGWRAVVASDALAGEARVAGRRLVALADACCGGDAPLCLVAGGETVVHVLGGGRGGRSQELALAAALAIDGRSDLALLAAGSDGADGPTDAAGAFADGGSVARGRRAGADAAAALADNDAYGFFEREGGLLRTGPTGTNVADLVLVVRGVAPSV